MYTILKKHSHWSWFDVCIAFSMFYVHVQLCAVHLEFVIPGLFSQIRDSGLRNFQSRDPGIGNK